MSSSSMTPEAVDSEAGPYVRYHNPPFLHDITIHYSGRHFYGHRLHLSVSARWFQNLFEGPFVEAHAADVTLRDDNPAALEGMLAYIYGVKISFPTIDISAANVIFCIELFRVAHKYTYCKLMSGVPDMFASLFDQLLSNLAETASSPPVDPASAPVDPVKVLRDIIQAVYKFEDTAWAGEEKFPIKKMLLDRVLGNKLTNPLGEVTELSTAVKQIAKRLPAFARDLYLYLMEPKSDDQGVSKWVEFMKVQGLYCDESFLLSIQWLDEKLLAL